MDKSNRAKFDVNVGTCDGVNLCELVYTFYIFSLRNLVSKTLVCLDMKV